MMAEAKKKPVFEKGNTPVGVAVFPRLDKPDYKFKKELGEFSVKLRFAGDAIEPLREKLQAALDKWLPEVKALYEKKLAEAENGKQKKAAKDFLAEFATGKLTNALPIKEAVDDDGEPTGEYEVTFKMPGNFKKKNADGTETLKPRSVKFVDAKGNEMKGTPSVWGGSELRVGYTIRPYETPKGVGVRLGLEIVKIIKLVSGGNGANASDYGMDDEEDGYEDDTSEATTNSAAAGKDVASEEDNPDF